MIFRIATVVFSALFLFGQTTSDAAEANKNDAYGFIFSAEQVNNLKFIPVKGPFWTPSQQQVNELEELLPSYLKEQSSAHHLPSKIDLGKYKRQYFGYTLSGKKIVYVNAFCTDFDDWKTTFVFVLDGGQCFFQADYDPETKKFIKFRANGHA